MPSKFRRGDKDLEGFKDLEISPDSEAELERYRLKKLEIQLEIEQEKRLAEDAKARKSACRLGMILIGFLAIYILGPEVIVQITDLVKAARG